MPTGRPSDDTTTQPVFTRRRLLAGVGAAGLGALGWRFIADQRRTGPGVRAGGAVQTLDAPATVTEPACRVSAPLAVDWIGGSDVELGDVSVPDATQARLGAVGARPVQIAAVTAIAPMAPDVAAMIDTAVAAGADVVVASINLVWQHWDGASCRGLTPPHEFYHCLLTPSSDVIDEQRAAEMQALVDTAAKSGIACYLYTAPHSTTALTDPLLAEPIATGEAWVASFDPHLAHVRLVASSFTRQLAPFDEGADFHDMVHPTPRGAERLGAWLADDLADFLGSLDLDPC